MTVYTFPEHRIVLTVAVSRITDNRMIDMFKVTPELMLAARGWLQRHQ